MLESVDIVLARDDMVAFKMAVFQTYSTECYLSFKPDLVHWCWDADQSSTGSRQTSRGRNLFSQTDMLLYPRGKQNDAAISRERKESFKTHNVF